MKKKKELENKGIVDEETVQGKGTSVTFYAKPDGAGASAGNDGDMLSPTTKSWLYFMMANPGALYPLILKEF